MIEDIAPLTAVNTSAVRWIITLIRNKGAVSFPCVTDAYVNIYPIFIKHMKYSLVGQLSATAV